MISSEPVPLLLDVSGVDLWYVPTPKHDYQSLFDRWGHWLDAGEITRLQQQKIPKGQYTFLLTRVTLRYLLSLYFPAIRPECWRFSRTDEGRPFVSAPDVNAPLFNLSHAENMLVFAFSHAGQPGVDIEKNSRQLPVLELAQRYFSVPETETLQALPDSRQADYFLMLWTLKEACVKASGKGLAKALKHYSFGIVQPSELLFYPAGDALDDQSHWRLWSLRQGDYRVALALRAQDRQKKCVVTPRELCWPNQYHDLTWAVDFVYGQ